MSETETATENLAAVDPDEYPDSTAEAKEKAAKSGLDVVMGDDYTLQLDLDTAADVKAWEWAQHRLDHVGIKPQSIETWASKSGNTHVVIRLTEPLPVLHRIGLQAALGSDRRREFLSFRDVSRGYEFPVMLFRPKGSA